MNSQVIISANIIYLFGLPVFRNYHVFYYLLAGASEEERTAFHLKKPEEYHYLSQVGNSAFKLFIKKPTYINK